MKETIGLLLCAFVYTITMVGLGMFLQMKVDQMQLKKFEEAAFTDGCKKCAMFEKMACDRDQVQGAEGFSQIP